MLEYTVQQNSNFVFLLLAFIVQGLQYNIRFSQALYSNLELTDGRELSLLCHLSFLCQLFTVDAKCICFQLFISKKIFDRKSHSILLNDNSICSSKPYKLTHKWLSFFI
jgi:hypothetical protein